MTNMRDSLKYGDKVRVEYVEKKRSCMAKKKCDNFFKHNSFRQKEND